MTSFSDNEALMVRLINLLAEKFPAQAVLKGGMVLRLLSCPRYTNDLDYVFIPYSSKKDIAGPVLEMLSRQDGLTVEHTMHSTCMRIVVSSRGARTQIELNAAPSCKTQELSTADLARSHDLQGRIIRAMRAWMSRSRTSSPHGWREHYCAICTMCIFYGRSSGSPPIRRFFQNG